MKPIDATVAKMLRDKPNATVRCILRTKAEAGQYRAAVEKRGLRVAHVSTLINALTVEGKAKAVLAVGGEEWVTAMELDKPVHTM